MTHQGKLLLASAIIGVGVSAWAGPSTQSLDQNSSTSPTHSPHSVELREAARFLNQATFGANYEEIERVSNMGLENWLEEEFNKPIGYHEPYLIELENLGTDINANHRRWGWWEQVMESPDQLRQRVAFALSEIFVISDANGNLRNTPRGMANYYDMLLDHSFGNYRDLLMDVSMHPVMGVYLSHLRNQKSDPGRGRFPDENYAREIMQLFSIGLFELRPDGEELKDGLGFPISTYDNADITEFARVFTGLSYASASGVFRNGDAVWDRPMRMYDAEHEPGPKTLLRGVFLPPGQTGMQDINDAIDCLANHPNVGPFIGKKLIQRLVTSNPSPAYVERVTTVFDNNGSGVRGDLKAVVRAILMDPEARAWPTLGDISNGKLRESYLRKVQMAKAFDAFNLAFNYPISDGNAPRDYGQRPLSSPTVFNFFMPDHSPVGPITDAGLVAPEFQVFNTNTTISSANSLRQVVDDSLNGGDNTYEVRLDLSDEIAIAWDARGLVDRLDLLMTFGNMSGPMKQVLVQSLEQVEDLETRTRMAVYLIAISPEYSVMK